VPTYDRRCGACGAVRETVERMEAPERVRCQACGKRAAVRAPCTPALQTSELPAGMRRAAAIQGMPMETRDDYRRLKARGIDFLSDRDIDVGTRGERPHKRAIREALRRVLDPMPIRL